MTVTEDFISLMPSEDEGSEDEHDENDENHHEDSMEASRAQRNRDFDPKNGLPPWMDTYVDHRRINPLVALHNEIVGFCKLMEPKDDEMRTRTDLLAKFTGLAESIFPNCKVEVFGSQVTG